MADLKVRCWDSDCLIGWLKKEEDKYPLCEPVLAAAEDGKLKIVISSLALVEVLKLKGHAPIPKDDAETIEAFFKNDYFIVREVDRRTAELARRVVWDHGVNPKDAVHVATAIIHKVPRLETFDSNLHARDGKVGDPPLAIGTPEWAAGIQTELVL